MSSNLPPGCSSGDIPGNRSEDVAWDKLHEYIDIVGGERGLEARDMRLALDIGLASLAVLQSSEYVIHTKHEIKMIEWEARQDLRDQISELRETIESWIRKATSL